MPDHLGQGRKGFVTLGARKSSYVLPDVLSHLGLACCNIITLFTADPLWVMYIGAMATAFFNVIKSNTTFVTRIQLIIRVQRMKVLVESHARLHQTITNWTHSWYGDSCIANWLSLNRHILQKSVWVSV